MTTNPFIIIMTVFSATLFVIVVVVSLLQSKEIDGIAWRTYLLIFRTAFLIAGSTFIYISVARWNHWLALIVTSLMGIGLIGNWYDKDRKKHANNNQ